MISSFCFFCSTAPTADFYCSHFQHRIPGYFGFIFTQKERPKDVYFAFFQCLFKYVMDCFNTPSLCAWNLSVMTVTAPLSPLTFWTNTCRRVRELEEELRLMDQNLKSMLCGEEEVLTIKMSPGSICGPYLLFL